MSAPDTPLLTVQDLHVEYPVDGGFLKAPRKLRAVAGLSFTVREGETLGVVGESGCGKSTVGRAILGFADPAAGRVLWRGRDLKTFTRAQMQALRGEMQIIFQNPLASLNPRMTVGDLVAEPLEVFRPQLTRAQRREVALDWLKRVGLPPEAAQRFPGEFSGGQAQRIAIARAMIAEPRLLICDEAVSALDVSIKAQIMALLRQLQRETGVALLFISHDLAVVRQVSHRILVMYLGKAMEIGGREVVFATPQHPYTQALISAAPIPDPEIERNRTPILLAEDLPSPLDPPSGCVFRTRCPIAKPNCITAVPVLSPNRAGTETACHYAGADLRLLAAE
ncbi:MAG: oligopeptide/dipeptide ABC transporter ATP-binding protein [Pseudomonadota bacterium]|uniref:ABC transporter ATP-binding protein n=1 Tax=Phenylobacterium sp. TaxID=1871053 RepID=UPI0025D102D2|nr:oligopeptide/dipeptide ABC transporter ATP-binding protein [Phenylobacterium sp.]MBT9470547.1 ATP-binding cassette domain-containing protein [Phenylobacterium sp.]